MQEWFSLITKQGLTPNQVYLLECMKSRITPVLINQHTELRVLKTAGWVREDNTLEQKSMDLLNELSSFFLARKKKAASVIMGPEFAENIQKYLDIFPNITLPSKKKARVHASNLEEPFKWFFQRYSYSWETILKAAQMYVTEHEARGYEHMRTSQYFVRKQNPDKTWICDLADYCMAVEENPPGPQDESSFEEKFN